MQFMILLAVIAAGMGLSVEAGLLGPLSESVGKLWATFSIFSVGAVLTFLLMLFFAPRKPQSYFEQPAWTLIGGLLGPIYVVILAIAVPQIGIALTMVGILAGQIGKSMLIDHFGWLGMPHAKINPKRLIALGFITLSLILMTI